MKIIASLVIVIASLVMAIQSGTRGQTFNQAAPSAAATKASAGDRHEKLPQREIVKLGVEDWETLFRGDYRDLSAETRADIRHVAASLQAYLAGGGDPRGEDAAVYADAIRALVAFKGE